MERHQNKFALSKGHIKRVITALVGIPLVIWLISGAPLEILNAAIIVTGLIAVWEHLHLWKLETPLIVMGLILNLALMITFCLKQPLLGIVLCLTFMGIFFIVSYGQRPQWVKQLPVLGFGLLYPTLFWAHSLFFLDLPYGRRLLLATIVMVFASDTLAFYLGCALGKHKLYPAVSPKKSWEGLIGAILGPIIISFVLWPFLPKPFYTKLLILSVFIGIIEQTGDLFESVLKRYHGVKDSSQLLPGHGGLLDRIDGLLLVLPVSYYFWHWLLK